MPKKVNEKFLIVNADDLGLSDKINKGILYAYQNGIVTAASVMTNMPAFEDALSLAEHNKGLDLGLHITLTTGSPASAPDKVKSLVDKKGALLSTLEFVKRYLPGKINYDDIYLEVENQLKKTFDFNVKITHIDCHHHLQALYKVYEALYKIALKYKIKFLRIPVSRSYLKEYMFSPGNFKRFALLTLAQNCLQKLPPSKIHYPIDVLGISEMSRLSDETVLNKLISKCGYGLNELICHPGYPDASIKEYDSYTNRGAEVTALTSLNILNSFEENNVKLTSYSRYRYEPAKK